jgi:hypothetical protein
LIAVIAIVTPKNYSFTVDSIEGMPMQGWERRRRFRIQLLKKRVNALREWGFLPLDNDTVDSLWITIHLIKVNNSNIVRS